MNVEYSEIEFPPDPSRQSAVLAVDAGSPVVSTAVGNGSRVVAEQSLELRESSGALIDLVDSTLRIAGLEIGDIGTLLGLRGPGSFTGVRVGLATLQGLAQALSARVGTLSTFQVLASLAPDDALSRTACVDALRGEWLVQTFSGSRAVSGPRLISRRDLRSLATSHIVGYGVSEVCAPSSESDSGLIIEPGSLAGRAIEMCEENSVIWGFEGLRKPIYQRPPAAVPLHD